MTDQTGPMGVLEPGGLCPKPSGNQSPGANLLKLEDIMVSAEVSLCCIETVQRVSEFLTYKMVEQIKKKVAENLEVRNEDNGTATIRCRLGVISLKDVK